MEKFDLTYLKKMSGGDNNLLIEMIELFCEQVPELIDDFYDYMLVYDYNGVASVAHKAKSSLAIVGLNDMAETIKKLEINARKESNTTDFPLYIEKFKEVSLNAVKDLTEYVTKIK